MYFAYCWASGVIELNKQMPSGAIEIAQSRSLKRLKDVIEVMARHAYDGVTLLVPGIPEADSDADKHAALDQFIIEINKRLHRRST